MRQDWIYKKVKEVANVSAGQGAPQGDNNYCDNGTPFIKAGNLEDLVNGMDEYYVQKVSEEVAKSHRLKKYKSGSVLFAKSGMSCMKGWVYILKNDCYVVSHLAIISPQSINSNFLTYYFRYNRPNQLVKDAAYPSISLYDIENAFVPSPPIEVQLSVVSELDKINELISLKKAQLNDLDALAQSIFYEMFGDPIENNKGWEVKKLGGHIKITGGYAFKSDQFTSTGIPVLRIGNINAGYFKDINMVFWEDDMSLKRYEIFPGDLVMSLTGTVGKSDYGNVCMIDEHFPKYYLNQRNAKIDIISGLDKFYLKSILGFDVIKSKLTGISRGVRQANISNKDIENLILPIPPLLLQQSFADKVLAIEKAKEKLNVQIDELQTLLASRMQYWFD